MRRHLRLDDRARGAIAGAGNEPHPWCTECRDLLLVCDAAAMSKPQAGKIHSLPSMSCQSKTGHGLDAHLKMRDEKVYSTDLTVRVSYTVDGQGSYCTVLNERHDVFVHPAPSSARHGHSGHSSGANGRGRNGTPVRDGSHSGCEAGARSGDVVGSCCLRDVAWGVCYARYVASRLYHIDRRSL